MIRPQVADRGDAIQPWRVAANISSKQSGTAGKGWPPILGLGVGQSTHSAMNSSPINS
jgi:hypothetical protein